MYKSPQLFYWHRCILFSVYHPMAVRALPFAISASFPVGFSSSTKSAFNLDIVILGSLLMKYKAGNINSVSLIRFSVITAPQKLVIIKCSASLLFRSWKLTRYFLLKALILRPAFPYKFRMMGVFLITNINLALHRAKR